MVDSGSTVWPMATTLCRFANRGTNHCPPGRSVWRWEGRSRRQAPRTSSFSSNWTRTRSYSIGKRIKAPQDTTIRPMSTSRSKSSSSTKRPRRLTAPRPTVFFTTTTYRSLMTAAKPGRTSMPIAFCRRWKPFLSGSGIRTAYSLCLPPAGSLPPSTWKTTFGSTAETATDPRPSGLRPMHSSMLARGLRASRAGGEPTTRSASTMLSCGSSPTTDATSMRTRRSLGNVTA